MIRLSFCTIGFQKNKWGKDRVVETPLSEILPVLAGAGYEEAELWWPHLADLTDAQQQALAEQMGEMNLGVSLVSPYFNFTSSVASADESLALAQQVITAARRVNARGVRCFTGKVGSAEATQDQWDRAVACLQQLADGADDLLWALETHRGNLMDTIDASETLVRRIDRPNVGLIFQPTTFERSYPEALDRLAPLTRHVHASNRGADGGAALDAGYVDYPWVLAQLARRGFAGSVSVEWMGDDPARVADREAKYLQSLRESIA